MFPHIPKAANTQFSILDAHFFRFALTKGAAIISDDGRVAEIGIDTCLAKVGISSNVRVPLIHKSIIHQVSYRQNRLRWLLRRSSYS